MRFKKGQTATEYLIILAVVIVIALIVVGVLGGIPSIGGGAKSNSANSYWRTAKIGVTSVKVARNASDTGNDLNITFRNNMPGTIEITNVSVEDSAGNSNFDAPNVVVSSGGSTQVDIANVASSAGAGESYSYSITVTYVDGDTNAEYIFTGDGNSLEGTIAQS